VTNNTASDPTTVLGAADLTITKTHTGSFAIGQPGAYTITVTNSGNVATAGAITVRDTLPGGLSYAPSGGTGWSVPAPLPNRPVTATFAGVLNPGESASFALNVNVAPPAADSGGVTNTATVSGGGELDTANDT